MAMARVTLLLAASLVLIASIRSAKGQGDDNDDDYYGYDGDDYDYDNECLAECNSKRFCTQLSNSPTKKVDQCHKYLSDRCEDSETPDECLDSYKSTKQGKCNKKILKNLIPCLKCEGACDDYDYDAAFGNAHVYGEGDEYYGEGDDDGGDYSETGEKCYDQCYKSKECKAMNKASPMQMNRCESYTERMCGAKESSTEAIACLEKMKNREDGKCSKAFRRNALACMKCENNCDNLVQAAIEAEAKCFDDCSQSASCMMADGGSDQRVSYCKLLMNRMCTSERLDSRLACLESISNHSDVGCPKEYRSHAIMCLKCDTKCGESNAGSPKGPERNIFRSGGEKCMAACGKTTECMSTEEEFEDKADACEMFMGTKCKKYERTSTCLDRLDGVADTGCPTTLRQSLSTCVKCEDRCLEVHGPPDYFGPVIEECMDACSNTSSCMDMEKASDLMVKDCEDYFDQECGESDDIIACMEGNTKEESTCRKSFRAKIIECMKCDRNCEEVAQATLPPTPPPTTSEMPPPTTTTAEMTVMSRADCEETCDSVHGCGNSGGTIKPECQQCLRSECDAMAIDCMITAIAVNCKSQCFVPEEATKKEKCDSCKADCSSLP